MPALACAWLSSATAQTLDEQYDFYLGAISRRCQNMNFEVDASLILLPGQAGPLLEAFCSGPLPVGGISTTSSQGGGTGASSNGRGAAEDAALRRRRERLRAEGRQDDSDELAAPAADDFSLLESGKTSVFLSMDYQYEKQKQTRYEAGHRSNLFNGTLGVDHRFGATALTGIALKYENLTGDFANSAGDFQTRGSGAVLYGSWFPQDNLFIDMNAGVIRRSLDTRRIVGIRRVVIGSPGSPPNISFSPPLTPVDNNTHSRESNAEIRSGYDFVAGRVTAGPRAGIVMRRAELDGFTERGNTPMTLIFDAQTEKSLQSSLGFQAGAAINTASGVILPQLNIDWLHEFSDDQRVITARFAEDLRPNPSRLRFLNAAPDRDSFKMRISTVAILPHGVSAFVSVEGTAGHEYLDRYGASIGVRMEL